MKIVAFAVALGLVAVLAGCDKDAPKPANATPANAAPSAASSAKAGSGW